MNLQFYFILFTPRFVSARTVIRETAHLADLAHVFRKMTVSIQEIEGLGPA